MSDRLKEELEAVESILMDDGLKITDLEDNKKSGESPDSSDIAVLRLEVQLHPLTGCEDEKKFVSLTLQLDFTLEYPDKEPKILIRNPRGLDDTSLDELSQSLKSKCHDFLGDPVIFELIDLCREFLTESNVPSCACAICLHNIVDEDVFHKTSCYHYFHSYCLGRYVKSMMRQHEEFLKSTPAVPGMNENRNLLLTCPVCREVLDDVRLGQWAISPPPKLEEDPENFKSSKELLEIQREMRKLFLEQKARGAIIDHEEEGKKFLVSTATSTPEPTATNTTTTTTTSCSEAAAAKVLDPPEASRRTNSSSTRNKKTLLDLNRAKKEQELENVDDEEGGNERKKSVNKRHFRGGGGGKNHYQRPRKVRPHHDKLPSAKDT